MIKGIVGCYKNPISNVNIWEFNFDCQVNQFVKLKPFMDWQDVKYVSIHDNDLVALANNGKGGVCALDLITNQVVKQFNQESTPCYITQTNDRIFTANYHSGKVMIYRKDDQLSLEKCIDTGSNSGAHQVVIYHNLLLVPCLLLDKICVYAMDCDYALVSTIHFNAHTGPRHAIICDNQLYVVSELSNQLFHFKITPNGQFCLIEQLDLLTQRMHGAAGAIRLSNSRKYLYVSIRQSNLIVVIDINKFEIIQILDCRGDHPRDIALSHNDNYLFVANRYSQQLHCFSVDSSTGLIADLLDSVKIEEAVSIDFFKEEYNE